MWCSIFLHTINGRPQKILRDCRLSASGDERPTRPSLRLGGDVTTCQLLCGFTPLNGFRHQTVVSAGHVFLLLGRPALLWCPDVLFAICRTMRGQTLDVLADCHRQCNPKVYQPKIGLRLAHNEQHTNSLSTTLGPCRSRKHWSCSLIRLAHSRVVLAISS